VFHRSLLLLLLSLALVVAACGSPPTEAPSKQSKGTAPLGGSGLSATYSLDGPYKFVQTDPQIWFNWGRLAPTEGMPPGDFSARWTGFVRPEFTEEYSFYLSANGQARLWINDQEAASGSRLNLTAGQMIPIRVEYTRSGDAPRLMLEWQSISLKREVVPAGRLYPSDPQKARPEVKKATVPTGQNLLINPDFEAGTASWSGTFSTVSPGQGGTGSAATVAAFGYVQQNLTSQRVEGGYTYYVEAWGKGQNCTVGFSGSTFQGANFGRTLVFNNTNWERKTATITIPANASWAGMYLASAGTACQFDNLNASAGELPPIPATPTVNLLTNGGFESGATNWSTNLGLVTMVPGRTGINAGQITNWAWVQNNLPGAAVVGGSTYTLKGWGRTPNNATCTLGFSGGGTFGGQPVSFATTLTFKDAAWQERGISVDVPEGITWTAVYMTNNAESCQYDDLVVGQAVPGGSGSGSGAASNDITLSSPVVLGSNGISFSGGGLGNPSSTFTWNFGDTTTGTGETVYKTYANPGLYTVSLTVTDAISPTSASVQAAATRTFTSQVSVLPSIYNMSSYQGAVTRAINRFAPSDPSTYVFDVKFPMAGLDYRWGFSDGSNITGSSVSKTFANPGFQDVTLTIRDNRGDSPTFGEVLLEEQTRVNVLIEPPAADMAQVSQAGTTITLNAGVSQGYGNLTYQWRFGDGTTQSGFTVTKNFGANGHYGVTLTVRDQVNQVATTDANILIGSMFNPQTPYGRVRATYGGLQATSAGTLTASDLPETLRKDFERSTKPHNFYAEGVGQGGGLSSQAVNQTIPSDFPFVLHNGASDIRITQRVGDAASRLLSSTSLVSLNGTPVGRGTTTWNTQGCDTVSTDVCQTIETFRGMFPATLASGVNTVNLIARPQGGSGETSFPTRIKAFAGLRVPRVLISVIPDFHYPFGGDVQTQEYTVTVAGKQELFLQVNLRSGSVAPTGYARFRIPVYAVDGAGNHLTTVNGAFAGKFADSRILTAVSASSMVDGRALVDTYVPFNSFNNGTTQFNLDQFVLASRADCTANTFYQPIGFTLTGCSTIATSYEKPVNLTRTTYPYRLTADFTSRTNRIFVGKSVQEWGYIDKNLRDAFSNQDRLSPLGLEAQSFGAMEFTRLVIGFLPVIGDSVDGLEQLYFAATGKQVDPVVAVLATAGLALDLATGGVGDVTNIFKGVYRVSRDAGGVVAVVIRQLSDGLFAGRITPTAYVNALKTRFVKVVILGTSANCGFLGYDCLKLYDQIAKRYQVKGNLSASGAVDRADQVYDNTRYQVTGSTPRDRIENMSEITLPFCPIGAALGGQARSAPKNILCPNNVVTDTVTVVANGVSASVTRIKQVDFTVDPAKFNGGTNPSNTGKRVRDTFGSKLKDANGNVVTDANGKTINLDDAGHLIPYLLGGRGTDENIVPMLARVNQVDIRPFERRLRNAASQPGAVVQVTIILDYANAATPMRPTRMNYQYTVNGNTAALPGYTNPHRFDNPLQ
jgi:PA14 domain/PKD domain/DNA/RNA non-specific endonuclease